MVYLQSLLDIRDTALRSQGLFLHTIFFVDRYIKSNSCSISLFIFTYSTLYLILFSNNQVQIRIPLSYFPEFFNVRSEFIKNDLAEAVLLLEKLEQQNAFLYTASLQPAGIAAAKNSVKTLALGAKKLVGGSVSLWLYMFWVYF